MIISASRRTDIPAFYSEWFFNRIRDGFVVTRNPFNANQLTKVRLESGVVDAIVFWTKNPEPMMGRLHELDGRGFIYYFTFTLNPYGRDMEPGLPGLDRRIETFRRLSGMLGCERVVWRYDPIFLSDAHTVAWHIKQFGWLASELQGSTEKAVISFIDMDYRNTRVIEKLGIRDASAEEKDSLAEGFSTIAREVGLTLATCAEDIDLARYGIEHNRCIDAQLIERIGGYPLKVGKDKNQRKVCGCVASVDIGIYNTCAHGCAYCYANFNKGAIAKNRTAHNPASPLLLGECDADDLEFKKDQKSLREMQTALF